MDWQDTLGALRAQMPDPAPGEADANQRSDDSPTVTTGFPAGQPRLDIVLERKGRAGKTATIITGFTCTDEELRAAASLLKKTLGTGGSARGGEILVQGDRRADVLKALTSLGAKARII